MSDGKKMIQNQDRWKEMEKYGGRGKEIKKGERVRDTKRKTESE